MKRGFARSGFLAWLVFGAADVATPATEDVFLRVSRRCTGGRILVLCEEEDCVVLAEVAALLLVAAGVDVEGFAGDGGWSLTVDAGCWWEVELCLPGGRPRGAMA